MTAQKKADPLGGSARQPSGRTRRTWRKKTPFDVIRDQEKKLDQEILGLERQLEDLKAQKAKLAKALAVFET